MKKIAVVTGTRAEYGLLAPVMRAIQNHPQLDLSIIATGMHLSHNHGYTINEIAKDGFEIYASVDMYLENSIGAHGACISTSLGVGMIGIARVFDQLEPDIVLILGDRGEALIAAITALHMNIPIAHIHGGDTMTGGVIDSSIRHAITKLAHIHFPATAESATRIKRLGEEPWRIHTVGAPGLDTILNSKLLSKEELVELYSLNASEPLLLVVQHPITTQPEAATDQMRTTLEALEELKMQSILIYPNSDAGGLSMIEVIKEYEHLPFLQTFKSLPHIDYLSLLSIADALVGNSSSGIIEASSFNLPVVNIGIRQEGRQRSVNVIDVDHVQDQIIEAIICAKFKQRVNCVNIYGDGTAGLRIANVLAGLEINQKLLQKKITY